MYDKKYYEVTPNVEVISNQSQSFFYPVNISLSNHLLQNYIYDTDEDDDIKLNDILPEIYDSKKDLNSLLDYTMICDEHLINIQLLFSELPDKDKKDSNIVQFLKSRGIFPNPNLLTQEEV